jgi:hypothetical protein
MWILVSVFHTNRIFVSYCMYMLSGKTPTASQRIHYLSRLRYLIEKRNYSRKLHWNMITCIAAILKHRFSIMLFKYCIPQRYLQLWKCYLTYPVMNISFIIDTTVLCVIWIGILVLLDYAKQNLSWYFGYMQSRKDTNYLVYVISPHQRRI